MKDSFASTSPRPRLAGIDLRVWPHLAEVPGGAAGVAARASEALFARACHKAGLVLDPANEDVDLIVDYDALFPRLARWGWLGLAESFIAGEWRAGDLHYVLSRLISSEARFPAPAFSPARDPLWDTEEVPPALISLSSGDGVSLHPGLFRSAVATTTRQAMRSFAPRSVRRAEPASHFVDVTRYDPPSAVERADLGPAQEAFQEALLDASDVADDTSVAEIPVSGGGLARSAIGRGGQYTGFTPDPATAQAARDLLTLEGMDGRAAIELTEGHVPRQDEITVGHDAVVSVGRIELLRPQERITLMTALDAMLRPGGKAVVVATCATDRPSAAARGALDIVRSYLWPGLRYGTVEEFHRVVDRHTGLRVIAQRHLGHHAELSLKIQDEIFSGARRDAAAAGFDIATRRLWRWNLAARRALVTTGRADVVMFVLRRRVRRRR